MDTVQLGFKAGRLTVNLSWWGDFWDYLIAVDTETDVEIAWPESSSIELRFYTSKTAQEPAASWPANIDDTRATWYKTKADVIDDVLEPGLDVARLIYFSPDGREVEWEVGVVKT
jgi:hypothetical protein